MAARTNRRRTPEISPIVSSLGRDTTKNAEKSSARTVKFCKIDSDPSKTRSGINKQARPKAGLSAMSPPPGAAGYFCRSGRLFLEVVALGIAFPISTLGAARGLGEALLDELQGFRIGNLVD